MYLHLGQDCIIRTKEILGIFDLDSATLSKHTRDYLTRAEKEGRVVNVTTELPKSFIVTTGQNAKVYISPVSYTHLDVYKRQAHIQYNVRMHVGLSAGVRAHKIIVSCDRLIAHVPETSFPLPPFADISKKATF